MNNETHQGYLVLADISGYASYLAGVELAHARDILAELLELIVERFKPLLTIVQLEGDAVFAKVPKTKILHDETLLELLESTYLAFRDRVEGIRRRTICECNACRAIPRELIEARRMFISPEEADAIITRTISASPIVVWEWLNEIQWLN